MSEKPIEKMAFSTFLDEMGKMNNADFLRIKGIINVLNEQRPAIVHGVQNRFHPVQWLDAWPDDKDQRTKLVVITRNIPRERAETLFNKLLENA